MAPPPRPRRAARRAVLALAVALAGLPGQAAGRLAIAPVKNDPAGQVAAQLEAALCEAGRCLPGALGGPRPSLARAWKLGAEAALLGSVWREHGGLVLSLALFTGGTTPARTWVLPLAAGRRLAEAQLARLKEEVDEAMGVKAEPDRTPTPTSTSTTSTPTSTSTSTATPTPTPTSTPTSTSTSTPTPTATPTPTPTPTSTATPTATSTPTPTPTPTSTPTSTATPRLAVRPAPERPRAILEAGVAPFHHRLRFPTGGTSPVGYTLSLPAMPQLRLELRPFAGAGPLSGAALFAEGGWLGGIAFPSGQRTHRATAWRLRAGVAWRLPLAGWLTVAPDLAWERESLVVGVAGGIKVPGLPDMRLAGASAGLALEAPLGRRLSLLAAGRATWWLQAGDLAGGARFYPGGTAAAAEAEAGAAVRLGGPLSLRLLGTWSLTRWRLDADPSGAFTVRTAEAVRWGGRAVLRLEL